MTSATTTPNTMPTFQELKALRDARNAETGTKNGGTVSDAEKAEKQRRIMKANSEATSMVVSENRQRYDVLYAEAKAYYLGVLPMSETLDFETGQAMTAEKKKANDKKKAERSK